MKGVLTLALVTFALLLNDFIVPVAATSYDAAADLYRSRAGYRQTFEDEETMALTRDVLQVKERIKDGVSSTGEVNSIDPGQEKDADRSGSGLDVVKKHDLTENMANAKPAKQHHLHQKIQEDKETTDQVNSVDANDISQLKKGVIETEASLKDDSNRNPNRTDSAKHQQVQNVEEERDAAVKENDPEKQLVFPLGQDEVEKNVSTKEKPNEELKLERFIEQRLALEERSQDNKFNSTDQVTQKPVKEDKLRQGALERQKQTEETMDENQKIEESEEIPLWGGLNTIMELDTPGFPQKKKRSEEKSHVEEKVEDSDSTTEAHSTDLDLEQHVKEIQSGQDLVLERRHLAGENSTESQTDENIEEQQKDEDVSGIQEEKLEGPVVRSPAEEKSEKELHQLQQEGSDKGRQIGPKETQEQMDEEGRKGGKAGNNTEKEEPFIFPEPYLLGPTINDWDEQRAEWLDQNPHVKSTVIKPKVLIVTGSQPEPCRSSVGDYFHLQSLKLKMDYARMHNYEIYYSFALLDPLFDGFWVKLPLIRNLMLTHPEIEWFFWIDSDAVFTDMLFEPPWNTYEGSNLVMWGWYNEVYEDKLRTAFNAGVFIIRNCQWSLDLIDKWSPMGPNGRVRDQSGKFLSAFLTGRTLRHGGNFPADDQSALAYLMITDEAVKSKVKLVPSTEYMISGYWADTIPLYIASMEKYHPGFGDVKWPFVTHFTGCSPCRGSRGSDDYNKCMEGFNIAYNFADNQVLAYMGFQHESLSSPATIRVRNETDRPLEFVGVNPWEERIAQLVTDGIPDPWS